MPCRDPRDEDCRNAELYERVRVAEADYSGDKEKIRELEAALCAIFNELERRNIDQMVIINASHNSGMNLQMFWDLHRLDDTARLSKDLNQYSFDEKALMRQILDNNRV